MFVDWNLLLGTERNNNNKRLNVVGQSNYNLNVESIKRDLFCE